MIKKRINRQRGRSLVELLLAGSLLLALVLGLAHWFGLTEKFLKLKQARGVAVDLNKVLTERIRFLATHRQANGLQIFQNLPYQIQIQNRLGTAAAPINRTTLFRTQCESVDGTPLATFNLDTLPSTVCPSFTGPITTCPNANSRFMIEVVENGAVTQTFPSPLSAMSAPGTGYSVFPVASILCVMPNTPATSAPQNVANGEDLRIEVATAFIKNGTDVVWLSEPFLFSVSDRALSGIETYMPN